MMQQRNILALVLLALSSSALAHEKIKCMACGDKLEDGQTEYTGLCSGINDPGNETTCSEQFQSCMSVIMTTTNIVNVSDTSTNYVKNCGFTAEYHASGCLQVNSSLGEFRINGSMCYCETEGCNNNFEANNNSSSHANLQIITMLLSFLSFLTFLK